MVVADVYVVVEVFQVIMVKNAIYFQIYNDEIEAIGIDKVKNIERILEDETTIGRKDSLSLWKVVNKKITIYLVLEMINFL